MTTRTTKTDEPEYKNGRFIFRLSRLQRQVYEIAAKREGRALSNWIRFHLDAAAEEKLREGVDGASR